MEKKDLPKIYEEFDLGGRIKALKGKKIKVKRLIPKGDGNYTVREESTFINQTNDSFS